MLTFLQRGDVILWGLNIALQWAVVAALLYTKAHREYPWFFGRMIFVIIKSLMLVTIARWGTYSEYFWVYWAGQACEWVMLVLVAREFMLKVFALYWRHAIDLISRVLWAVCFFAVVMLLLALPQPANIVEGMLNASVVLNFVVSAVFLLALMLSERLKNHKTMLALVAGLVFIGIVTIVCERMLSLFPYYAHPFIRQVEALGSAVGKAAWVWGLWKAIPSPPACSR